MAHEPLPPVEIGLQLPLVVALQAHHQPHRVHVKLHPGQPGHGIDDVEQERRLLVTAPLILGHHPGGVQGRQHKGHDNEGNGDGREAQQEPGATDMLPPVGVAGQPLLLHFRIHHMDEQQQRPPQGNGVVEGIFGLGMQQDGRDQGQQGRPPDDASTTQPPQQGAPHQHHAEHGG